MANQLHRHSRASELNQRIKPTLTNMRINTVSAAKRLAMRRGGFGSSEQGRLSHHHRYCHRADYCTDGSPWQLFLAVNGEDVTAIFDLYETKLTVVVTTNAVMIPKALRSVTKKHELRPP